MLKNVLISTKTQEEYDDLMKALEEKTNLKWNSGCSPLSIEQFEIYEDKTYIALDDVISFGDDEFDSYDFDVSNFKKLTTQEALDILNGKQPKYEIGKVYKTTEEIREVLSNLGYEAHGLHCKVVLEDEDNEPVEAIIHCKDVPKDEKMRWYFCQDYYQVGDEYSGNKHGKKFSRVFLTYGYSQSAYRLEFTESLQKPRKAPTTTELTERKINHNDTDYTATTINGNTIDEVSKLIDKMKLERDELNKKINASRQNLKTHAKFVEQGMFGKPLK